MEKNRLESLISSLKARGITLSLAESMTAGLAISELSDVPGISDVLLGGIISYKRETKEQLLDVPPRLIDEKSAESQAVTTAMARGLRNLFNSTITVAVTGAASEPDPKSSYQLRVAVGTVFFTFIYESDTEEFEEHYKGSPADIRQQAVDFIYSKIEEMVKRKSSVF